MWYSKHTEKKKKTKLIQLIETRLQVTVGHKMLIIYNSDVVITEIGISLNLKK